MCIHMRGLFTNNINSSPPSAAYMHQWTGSALVQIMAWHQSSDKPLSEPMMVLFTEAYMHYLDWWVNHDQRAGPLRCNCFIIYFFLTVTIEYPCSSLSPLTCRSPLSSICPVRSQLTMYHSHMGMGHWTGLCLFMEETGGSFIGTEIRDGRGHC